MWYNKKDYKPRTKETAMQDNILTRKLSDKQIDAVNAIDEDDEIIAFADAKKRVLF